MYGIAFSGICLCLFEMKSIGKLIIVKILTKICNECVTTLDFFRNILKQRRKFITLFCKPYLLLIKKEYLR